MTDKQEQDREIIHRLLDDDLDPEEKKLLLERVEADPALREELESMTGTIRLIETSERMQAPPFFTAEVMCRLPKKKPTTRARIREFLFGSRVLRWNVATVAAAALVALVVVQVVRTQITPLETAAIVPRAQTVVVTMHLHAPKAHSIAVAGTFNKWDERSHMLTKQEDGVWTISIPLKPGEYSYMFIVDGKAWVTDPNAETYRDDGFGNRNAVMRVTT
jgi:anti-sigma-K factor RskA